ncbi:DsbA family protein [Catenovulum sp. SM1970]|uniref:DsbA family protein n=1 Tax=Marinifaba aquimaris TaxID=2741323 RepID=UPI0015748043|nr:DsbA family protein [Marinifaba aquimaris]NTS78770.1 DsbA family protein [Marinifaba aquimaris]
MKLVYVMDPMCAWCYAFAPELAAFLSENSQLELDLIMGGLAPDTQEPMPQEMRETIAGYWHQIEAKTQIKFNHKYWQMNTPYRSTYLACRAVIAASHMIEDGARLMIEAIQTAYYQQAKNPSLTDTLCDCASTIEIDVNQFNQHLTSQHTQAEFIQHLAISQQFGVTGFPALFYINDDKYVLPLTLGFCTAKELTDNYNALRHKR